MQDNNTDTDEDMRAISKLLAGYEDLGKQYRQERLVELLRQIQEIYGFIPDAVIGEIEKEFQIKSSVIRSILKYFPSLRPVKRHRIVLCTGPRCSQYESGALAEAIREAIGKKRKNPSGDIYTFTTQNCLKQCRTAPNLTIDGRLYKSVKAEDIPSIIP